MPQIRVYFQRLARSGQARTVLRFTYATRKVVARPLCPIVLVHIQVSIQRQCWQHAC